jgi:hypothetical protein
MGAAPKPISKNSPRASRKAGGRDTPYFPPYSLFRYIMSRNGTPSSTMT